MHLSYQSSAGLSRGADYVLIAGGSVFLSAFWSVHGRCGALHTEIGLAGCRAQAGGPRVSAGTLNGEACSIRSMAASDAVDGSHPTASQWAKIVVFENREELGAAQ